jgi:thioesterase domain-containing protein
MLRTLSAAFGADQPIYGMQAYVSENIVDGIVDISATAEECLKALREERPHGPYVVTGHSIGGYIAFDMAARLEALGEEVVLLGLIDPPSPHTLRLPSRVVAGAREIAGIGPGGRRPGLQRMLWAAARRQLRGRLVVRAETTGKRAVREADGRAWTHLSSLEKHYQPPPFHGRTVVYTTAATVRTTGSVTLGWDRYVNGDLDLRRVQGDHESMLTETGSDGLFAAMNADVKEARLAAEGPAPRVQ